VKSLGRSAAGLGAILVFLCAAFASSAQAATCPNEAIRKTQTSEALPKGTVDLPACMALEMIDPPQKFGQETGEVGAFSTDGGRALFKSKAALAETPGLHSFGGDNYVTVRGQNGWTTAPTSPPAQAQILFGAAGNGGPYAFSSDLGSWAIFGATQSQNLVGEGQIFTGGLDGSFAPLSPLLVGIDDSGISQQFANASFDLAATSTDLTATVFESGLSTTTYLPGDPTGTNGMNNSYLAFLDGAGEPTVQLLARDKTGKVWGGRCGASIGGQGGGPNQGALSADGSQAYVTTRPAQPFDSINAEGPACSTANPLRILRRVATPTGPEITELLPGGPSAPGDDLYQGATLDRTKVFFTSPRALTASDLDPSAQPCSSAVGSSQGCDLYLYDSAKPEAERLTQLSAGGTGDPTPGEGADVLSSITAISPDGSHVYFVAQGVLTTTANPSGQTAQAGQPNLYLYERDAAHPSGRTVFVGTLATGDNGSVWGSQRSFFGGAYAVPLRGPGGSGAGDGHTLFLKSKAPLTPNDTDGGHSDIFRYESAALTLQCISCAAGGPDPAPFDALAGSKNVLDFSANFAEQGRWASEDGQTVAFVTAQPLVSEDEDSAVDPYFWREGQLVRLPGRLSGPGSFQQFPTVSGGGEEVGFTSVQTLLPQDGDSARDAYIVRVDGGFPNPAPAVPCNPLSEGACQGPAAAPPGIPTPATPSFIGAGNERPVTCKKTQVRKRGKCVKAHHKKKQHKRSSNKRGGSK
jgi:hypothetical protein